MRSLHEGIDQQQQNDHQDHDASVSATKADDERKSRDGADQIGQEEDPINLILAGYSYGSLVASRLPPLPTLLASFYPSPSSAPAAGSAPSEILLRARRLASETLAEAQRQRRREQSSMKHHRSSPVTIGGEESSRSSSDGGAQRRKSKDHQTRRSLDVGKGAEKLKRAWERHHHHHHHHQHSHNTPSPPGAKEGEEEPKEGSGHEQGTTERGPSLPLCEPAYLLISPLLPPTSLAIAPGLATSLPGLPAVPVLSSASSFFAVAGRRLGFSSGGDVDNSGGADSLEHPDPLLRYPTLAIFGTADAFTNAKRLGRWAEGMKDASRARCPGFGGVVVEGASHFWQERGAMARLRAEVRGWVGMLGCDVLSLTV